MEIAIYIIILLLGLASLLPVVGLGKVIVDEVSSDRADWNGPLVLCCFVGLVNLGGLIGCQLHWAFTALFF